jgi:serine/threonine protein kinase
VGYRSQHDVGLEKSQRRCPKRADLRAFLNGASLLEDSDWMGEHLDDCPRCSRLAAELVDQSDSVVRMVRQVKGNYEAEAGFQQIKRQLLTTDPRILADSDQSATGLGGQSLLECDAAPLPKVIDDYQLFEQIGEGGMGRVYRAFHLNLKRNVALKVMSPSRMHEDDVARFRREMEAIGRLDDPHVVRATDAGEDNGLHFLVMEYVDGMSVSKLVDHVGPLPQGAACEIIRQAATGLRSAHRLEMVHRDVKPSNLYATYSGQVKLLDLGLVSFAADRAAIEEGDEETLLGTADYMAPEQWTGQMIDRRADIYSLGCTFYKLLTGRAPFAESNSDHRAKMQAHLETSIAAVRETRPEISPQIEAVVARMTAKRPADRFADMTEVCEAIAPFADPNELLSLIRREMPSEETVRISRTEAAVRGAMRLAAGKGRLHTYAWLVGIVAIVALAFAALPFIASPPEAEASAPADSGWLDLDVEQGEIIFGRADRLESLQENGNVKNGIVVDTRERCFIRLGSIDNAPDFELRVFLRVRNVKTNLGVFLGWRQNGKALWADTIVLCPTIYPDKPVKHQFSFKSFGISTLPPGSFGGGHQELYFDWDIEPAITGKPEGELIITVRDFAVSDISWQGRSLDGLRNSLPIDRRDVRGQFGLFIEAGSAEFVEPQIRYYRRINVACRSPRPGKSLPVIARMPILAPSA